MQGFACNLTKSIVDPPVPLKLFGEVLPWVLSCDHLGHNLNISGTMDGNCRRKRAEFIDKSVKMRELFQFAHPYEIVFATQKYCSDFYGSNLYDLRSNTSKMLFSSWRTNVKLSWNLPRNCNNIFIESLAPNVVPPNIGLLTRFHNSFSVFWKVLVMKYR